MSEEGVLVYLQLGVKRYELALLIKDEGVYLHQRGVKVGVYLVQCESHLGEVPYGKTQLEGELACLMGHESQSWIYLLNYDGVGVFLGYLLYLHTSCSGHHHHGLRPRPVKGYGHVKLFVYVGSSLYPHPADRLTIWTLEGLENLSQHTLNRLFKLFHVLDYLYSASFTSPSAVNLRLYHEGEVSQLFGYLLRLL